jgi:hypothetical protein
MAAVLSSRVNNCLTLFKNLITNDELSRYHDEVPENLWQDELGRFRVWAANIGAHQVDQSSLDYRLRDASHIRDQILSLLVGLQGTIKYLEEVVAENPDDYEEELSDGEGTTEVQQIYSGLVDNINCLFRMSMLIRKPARHDRLLNFEKQDVITYEQFDQRHVREKFPHANRVVSDRLGNAISRRRADLKYRERHHKKLSKGIDRLHDEGAPSTYMSETIASEFKEESNIQFDERGSSAGLSQTSYAQTMLGGHQAMTIPPPPKESANDQPFECPYCFFIITIQNRASWARHVFRDIMPYICIFPDCSTPNRLYDSRREWYGHLASKHISSGPDIRHICPLCREESLSDNFLQRHLGRHLQELALFAIPKPDDDEEPDADKSEDAFDPFQNSSVESEEYSDNDDDVIPDGSTQALKEQGGSRVPPKHQPSEDILAAPAETPLLDLSKISLNYDKVSDYEESLSQKVESNKAIVADPEVASTPEAASSKSDIRATFHLPATPVMHSKAGMEDETPRESELLPLNRLGDAKAMTRDEVLDRFFQDSRENFDHAEEASTDSPAQSKTTLGGAFEYNASEHTSTSSKSSDRRNRDSRRSQRSLREPRVDGPSSDKGEPSTNSSAQIKTTSPRVNRKYYEEEDVYLPRSPVGEAMVPSGQSQREGPLWTPQTKPGKRRQASLDVFDRKPEQKYQDYDSTSSHGGKRDEFKEQETIEEFSGLERTFRGSLYDSSDDEYPPGITVINTGTSGSRHHRDHVFLEGNLLPVPSDAGGRHNRSSSTGAAPQPQVVNVMVNDRSPERSNKSPERRYSYDQRRGRSSESVSSEEERRYGEHRRRWSKRKSELDAETIVKLDRLKVYEEEADREYERKLKEEIEIQKARELYEAEQKAKEYEELEKEYVERWKREETEKKEKEEKEKEEEDRKFEERFKIQFMQAGYTEAQAEAVLKKKKEKEKEKKNTIAIDLSRPTRIKVKRKWLLPETLDHYYLPWEWDVS